MKTKVLLLVLCAFTMMQLVGCNQRPKSSEEPILRPASMYYSSEDTVVVNELIGEYIGYLKDNEFERAADMLYRYQDKMAIPYTPEEKLEFVNGISMFNIYDCKLKGITLRSECNNEAQILAQIIPDGDIAAHKGVITVALNPVLVDGAWFLTLLDKDAEGVEDIY